MLLDACRSVECRGLEQDPNSHFAWHPDFGTNSHSCLYSEFCGYWQILGFGTAILKPSGKFGNSFEFRK